jgi:hypothetical protein
MNTLKLCTVGIALVAAAMLLGASLYDQVVLAPNFLGAPASLEHARGFMHSATPANLFRVLSPATQILLLLALVLNWKPSVVARWRLAVALVLGILGDVITFTWHYPRNDILFGAPLTRPAADFDRVAVEWAMGNYARIAVVLAAVLLTLSALVRVSRNTAARP